MKQRVFALGGQFTVKDETGADRFFVEGEVFALGRKLHVMDAQGQELAFVRQRLFSFPASFDVEMNGREVARIVREFTFFRQSFIIEGLGWQVRGDFMSHDYEVTHAGRTLATIAKAWFTWGDSYELDISPDADVTLLLAVVLAIDCVLDAARR